jgi:hypothetical protein
MPSPRLVTDQLTVEDFLGRLEKVLGNYKEYCRINGTAGTMTLIEWVDDFQDFVDLEQFSTRN